MQKSPWSMETSLGTFLLSYLICSHLLYELVYISINISFRKYISSQPDHASGCSNRYSSCKHKHR